MSVRLGIAVWVVVGIRQQHCEAVRRTATNRHAGHYVWLDRADAHAIVATRWRVKYGCRPGADASI
ncbi:hypothetical protein KDX05_08330 [Burkholderia vietnamiensis]|uniref:hypothetical protein n=1 Tax=Burkholderia vietnamiensis TaxID=60552 RepID=UPI001B90A6DC|nr:hypothetical protein [Burkholderia vietnamiensis]MBR8228309.1 hypothetical protein [Burkholderia vietnamiensis]